MLANHQKARNPYADPFNNGLYHNAPSLSQEIDIRQLSNAELDAGLEGDIAAIEEDLDEILCQELGQPMPGLELGPAQPSLLDVGDGLVGPDFDEWFTQVLVSTG